MMCMLAQLNQVKDAHNLLNCAALLPKLLVAMSKTYAVNFNTNMLYLLLLSLQQSDSKNKKKYTSNCHTQQ